MHDIKAIRDDKDAFIAGLEAPQHRRRVRRIAEDVLDLAITACARCRHGFSQAQARRNEASKLMEQAKAKKDEAQASALMAEVADLKVRIQSGEEEERRG